jgi:hypothetical protein
MSAIKRPFVPKPQVFYEEPAEEFVHEPIRKERLHPVGTYYDACEPFEYVDDTNHTNNTNNTNNTK